MFEQLLNSLMGTGTQVAQAAPTSMEAIRVPQMPLEPGSIAPAVGANVASNVPQTMAQGGTQGLPPGLLQALAAGGVSAFGGNKQEQVPMVQAPAFRGSAQFDNPGAEVFSNRRAAGTKLRGILNG